MLQDLRQPLRVVPASLLHRLCSPGFAKEPTLAISNTSLAPSVDPYFAASPFGVVRSTRFIILTFQPAPTPEIRKLCFKLSVFAFLLVH